MLTEDEPAIQWFDTYIEPPEEIELLPRRRQDTRKRLANASEEHALCHKKPLKEQVLASTVASRVSPGQEQSSPQSQRLGAALAILDLDKLQKAAKTEVSSKSSINLLGQWKPGSATSNTKWSLKSSEMNGDLDGLSARQKNRPVQTVAA